MNKTAFLAKVLDGKVDGDLVYERGQLGFVAKFAGAQLAYHHHEGVLAEIARDLRITGALEKDQARAAEIPRHHLGLCFPVAVLDALDEAAGRGVDLLLRLKHGLPPSVSVSFN